MDAEGFETVARLGEIGDGLGKSIEVGGRTIVVFRDGLRYHALDDVCPHQGFPLCDGPILDGTVTCLFHGWQFRLKDGGWVDDPRVRVATYPVRVVGDAIQVNVSFSLSVNSNAAQDGQSNDP